MINIEVGPSTYMYVTFLTELVSPLTTYMKRYERHLLSPESNGMWQESMKRLFQLYMCVGHCCLVSKQVIYVRPNKVRQVNALVIHVLLSHTTSATRMGNSA